MIADNFQAFEDKIERQVLRNLDAAGFFLVSQIRPMISTPSRTVSHVPRFKGDQLVGMKKVLGPRGSNRSKPGEPPHKDYGRLRASIARETVPNGSSPRCFVGSALPHAKFLELGTVKMAARPFLRRALGENQQRITEIVTTGFQRTN
jgi:HK97 gp10 family phage protein